MMPRISEVLRGNVVGSDNNCFHNLSRSDHHDLTLMMTSAQVVETVSNYY